MRTRVGGLILLAFVSPWFVACGSEKSAGEDCEAGEFCPCAASTECPAGETCDPLLLICVASGDDAGDDTGETDAGRDAAEDAEADTPSEDGGDAAADVSDATDVTLDTADVATEDVPDIVPDTSPDVAPDVSPDAEEDAGRPEVVPIGSLGNPWIAYVETLPDETGKIAFVRADGTGYTRLVATEPTTASPAWSLDGTRLAYVGQSGAGRTLNVVDVTTGELLVVTPPRELARNFTNPRWSPWGEALVFEGRPSGQDNNDLFVVDLSTGETRVLVATADNETGPVWTALDRIYYSGDTGSGPEIRSVDPLGADGTDHDTDGDVVGIPAVSLFARYFVFVRPAGADSFELVRVDTTDDSEIVITGESGSDPALWVNDQLGVFTRATAGNFDLVLFNMSSGEIIRDIVANPWGETEADVSPIESEDVVLFWSPE